MGAAAEAEVGHVHFVWVQIYLDLAAFLEVGLAAEVAVPDFAACLVPLVLTDSLQPLEPLLQPVLAL